MPPMPDRAVNAQWQSLITLQIKMEQGWDPVLSESFGQGHTPPKGHNYTKQKKRCQAWHCDKNKMSDIK
eukprot:1867220-Ditylum_brightwellii.AAC.1